MDTKHRDRYRVSKTRLHGKGEKKRPGASGNAEHNAPKRPEMYSQNINAQNESQTPRNDAPLQGEATRHDNPQRDTSHNDANKEDTPSQRPPLATFNLLLILPRVKICADTTLLIRNPRADGPQTDICARIPGSENNWAARVSCYDGLCDLYDWIRGNSGEEHPEIWMYVSSNPPTFINIKVILAVSLSEPVSIVAFTNPLPSGRTLVSLASHPLFGLRAILGEEGSKWLV
ncbi:hypothetical protein FACUT_10175 [Fusarium acutatum]|uniref:Uncharacterized protein n=1 Tax=Fusarium acutatum TaxID=78861 RepID=A0A8H4JFN6_9HYPO|nr:hypothetical protein FACUT_10175 [Fusarium acutatum]